MSRNKSFDYERFVVPSGQRVRLKDYPPDDTAPFDSKSEVEAILQDGIARMADAQARLSAQNSIRAADHPAGDRRRG